MKKQVIKFLDNVAINKSNESKNNVYIVGLVNGVYCLTFEEYHEQKNIFINNTIQKNAKMGEINGEELEKLDQFFDTNFLFKVVKYKGENNE